MSRSKWQNCLFRWSLTHLKDALKAELTDGLSEGGQREWIWCSVSAACSLMPSAWFQHLFPTVSPTATYAHVLKVRKKKSLEECIISLRWRSLFTHSFVPRLITEYSAELPEAEFIFLYLEPIPINKPLNTSRFCVAKRETALQENLIFIFHLYTYYTSSNKHKSLDTLWTTDIFEKVWYLIVIPGFMNACFLWKIQGE